MNRATDTNARAKKAGTSTWKTCGQVYGKLARDSGLPGTEALVTGGHVRRLLWMGALVTLLYFSAKETGSILREYFTYKVAVTFQYNTNESFEMPDVTICNVNPLRLSKLCGLDSSERKMNSELEHRLCGQEQEFTEANVSDVRLQKQISDWVAEYEVRKRNGTKLLGHQFTDAILGCSFNEHDCKDKRYFRYRFTTFFGNCFCFHCDQNDPFFDYSTLSSPYKGLVITLNPELHEYLPTSYHAGFIAMIHSHDTRHAVCSDSVYLTPGFTTYVGLDLMEQTGLPAPYASPCRNSWSPILRSYMEEPYGAYAREDCLNLCLQYVVVTKCGCLSAQLPQLELLAKNHEACRGNELACVRMAAGTATSLQLEEQCECQRACLDISYDRDVTTTLLREGYTGASEKNGPPTRLVLYFNSLSYEQITAVPKYDDIGLLSNLGGINGMYLGLSFFVIFQVLDIIVCGVLQVNAQLPWDSSTRRFKVVSAERRNVAWISHQK